MADKWRVVALCVACGVRSVWLALVAWCWCGSVGVRGLCAFLWALCEVVRLWWLCFPSRLGLWLDIFACIGFLAIGLGSCKGYVLKCDYKRFLRG